MTIKQLSDREHILHRPAMYIGAVDAITKNEYITDNNTISFKEISYVPGLIKIINEVIDNSVDVAIKTNFKSSNVISIKMTDTTVTVTDNGTGIPVKDSGTQPAELCWGNARAGSNFDDDENRTQIGMNGIGAFASNVFSTLFSGSTDDGNKKYTINFKNNAESFTDKLSTSSGKSGVSVVFKPDLDKFNLTGIDETHRNVIKQRLLNLSMSFPLVTFKFNGKKINAGTFKKYVQMFSTDFVSFETDDYKFAVIPSESDDFRQISYVNGLNIPDAGTHIDIISNNIVQVIRTKLQRKYKSIKPADIKNKLMVVAFMKDLKNPKFNSQTKEKITNSIAEINKYLGDVPYEQLGNKILRTPSMIDPITEVYRIKEEFKRRQELKALNKPKKKIKSEKYYPSIGIKKYLCLVEGQCLAENTPVLMHDYSTKNIKDVDIGDYIISGDLEKQQVLGKTKLLKPTLTFRTKTSVVTCGLKHKLKVYDTFTNTFDFIEGEIIASELDRYKFVKSKINESSRCLLVHVNNCTEHRVDLDEGCITYTDDDNFTIIRDGVIMVMHSLELRTNDLILMA